MRRAESHGKRLLESAVAGSASRMSFDRSAREFGPASAKTPYCVVTSWISMGPKSGALSSAALRR